MAVVAEIINIIVNLLSLEKFLLNIIATSPTINKLITFAPICCSNNKSNTNDIKDKVYNSYSVGDKVSLSDSSVWNVLESSTKDDEFVTLLSVSNINNNSIAFTEASNYITTTYKDDLISKNNATDKDIKEIRLISLEDISKLSGISTSELIPGKSLENNSTPAFLYESQTITSKIEGNNPIMICNPIPEFHETNPGRICIGTQTDKFEIRPVIVISKQYIK